MCIEISDDGKGMDPEKIAAVAVKKGVISQEQSSRLTDKEKVNLIFLPGFSTAEKVTGLSGRGVGMDVVRSMIASFNGVVDIDTKIGEGSTFVLKIPLTLAIIQALLVTVGGEVYALPLDAVTEIIKVPAKDIYSVDGNATVKLRNHALSLIELEKVIKVSPNKQSDEEYKRLVIVTDGESRLGVLVDSLLGKDEIVIKSFTKHFARVKGVIGASILADGNVALILDPATIIKESR
jgi:two-component system chemotaxis sensor kinase CheA